MPMPRRSSVDDFFAQLNDVRVAGPRRAGVHGARRHRDDDDLRAPPAQEAAADALTRIVAAASGAAEIDSATLGVDRVERVCDSDEWGVITCP